jgi:hypothetical protein
MFNMYFLIIEICSMCYCYCCRLGSGHFFWTIMKKLEQLFVLSVDDDDDIECNANQRTSLSLYCC